MSFGNVKISAKGSEVIVDENILGNEQNYIKDGRVFFTFASLFKPLLHFKFLKIIFLKSYYD